MNIIHTQLSKELAIEITYLCIIMYYTRECIIIAINTDSLLHKIITITLTN